MAINTQKLLPPSKFSTPTEKTSSVVTDKGSGDNTVLVIRKKLITIDKLLKNSLLQEKKETGKKKRKKQIKSREEREKNIETPKGLKVSEKVKSLIPATGILDAVQRFVTFTFVGWLFTKFSDNLPKLIEITKNISPIINTAEKIIGGIFEGVVGFIDAGYKTVDNIRKLSKDIGGEKAQKIYDDFTKNFNYITNAILTLGLSTLVQPKPTPTKSNGGLVNSYAQGGTVTRGGQVVGGGIGRTLKTQPKKSNQQQKIRPQQTQPGKDVGGKKQIEKLYPNPKVTETGKPNPYKVLSDASKSLKKSGTTGIIMASGIDLVLGQNLESNLLNSLTRDITLKSKINEILQNVRKEINKKISSEGRKSSGELNNVLSGRRGDGSGGYSQDEKNFVSSKEIYDYLKSKGVSHIHALGMLANIQAESSFDAGAIGDNGSSGGLFQHHASRFEGMKSYAGKNWNSNWKGQIDYALKESAGKQYIGKKFKNAEEASAWFTLNFERPADKESKARERLGNLNNFNIDGSWKGPQPTLIEAPKTKLDFKKLGMTVGERAGYSQSRGRIHAGRDIAIAEGTPLRTLSESEIVAVGYESGYGNYVVFRDKNGREMLYGHLKEPSNRKVGDKLRANSIVGYVGSTGRSSGAHLHWEVSDRAGEVGVPRRSVVDPLDLGYKSKDPFGGEINPKPQTERKKREESFTKIINGKTWKKRPDGKWQTGSGRGTIIVSNADLNQRILESKPKPKPTIKPKPKPSWWDSLLKPKPKPSPSLYETLNPSKKQGGGFIGPQSRRNYSSLSSYPSYEIGGGMMIAVQPIIVEKPVPMPTGGNKSIIFPVPVSVNSNTASLRR